MGECGDCTVCCTLSAVKEIKKEAWETCKYCINKGCSIYEKHPQECKDFQCAYLQANAPIQLRPDKCGIMFFKKSNRIIVGAMVPEIPMTDTGRGQVEAFKQQGYSVIMLKQFAKPHLEIAKEHNKDEIWQEYINLLKNGNL